MPRDRGRARWRYFYLVDRRTDLILSGGANIYPAEVEAALDGHDEVLSSAVVGLPDDHAIVQRREGSTLSTADLLAHVGLNLARYKVPRSVCGAPTAKPHQPFAIEVGKRSAAEVALEHGERGRLGSSRRAADVGHICDMKVDQVAERADTGGPRRTRWLPAIDLSLGVGGPLPGVFVPDERFADGPAFAADLDAPTS